MPAIQFRTQCRLLRSATLVVFVGLALIYALGVGGLPWISSVDVEQARTRALLMTVATLPALGYLWALWALQRALAELAQGRMFQPTVALALRRMGSGVLSGALINVFLVTNLSRLIIGGRGSYLYFDLSGIVLGVIGAALILLARLIDQARAMQDELDEIL